MKNKNHLLKPQKYRKNTKTQCKTKQNTKPNQSNPKHIKNKFKNNKNKETITFKTYITQKRMKQQKTKCKTKKKTEQQQQTQCKTPKNKKQTSQIQNASETIVKTKNTESITFKTYIIKIKKMKKTKKNIVKPTKNKEKPQNTM